MNSKHREFERQAKELAEAVVRVFPQMNRYGIQYRVYHFLVTEDRANLSPDADAFFYQTEDVIDILETAFDNTATTSDDLAVGSDVRWAFSQLNYGYQYRILERYQHGIDRPHRSKERDQLNDAVAKLTDILNTWNLSSDHVGPGARSAVTSAKAQGMIDSDYSGGTPVDPWGWKY